MALRVLLADESSTIKKVMQLALQDFGVEVKAVPIGLDVLQVARSFQPDLIFADVLLSKRNGYEVATDIKNDPSLKKTPVVLMWSGFMELDEAKAKSCGAERRLEKPFDADHLRSLVKDLVPRLGENKISDYLSFPDLPEIVETPAEPPPFHPPTRGKAPNMPIAHESPLGMEGLEAIELGSDPGFEAPDGILSEPPPPPPPKSAPAARPMAPPPKVPSAPVAPQNSAPRPPPPKAPPAKTEPEADFSGIENIDRDLDDPDDFQQVPLPGSRTKNNFEQRETEDWRTTSLEQFRVAPAEASGLPDPLENPDGMIEVSDASIAMTGGVEDVRLDDLEDLTQAPTHKPKSAPPPRARTRTFTELDAATPAPLADIDPMRAEEVLREQVREVLESIAWKIIPDIAERVVREEIQRLLKEAERLS